MFHIQLIVIIFCNIIYRERLKLKQDLIKKQREEKELSENNPVAALIKVEVKIPTESTDKSENSQRSVPNQSEEKISVVQILSKNENNNSAEPKKIIENTKVSNMETEKSNIKFFNNETDDVKSKNKIQQIPQEEKEKEKKSSSSYQPKKKYDSESSSDDNDDSSEENKSSLCIDVDHLSPRRQSVLSPKIEESEMLVSPMKKKSSLFNRMAKSFVKSVGGSSSSTSRQNSGEFRSLGGMNNNYDSNNNSSSKNNIISNHSSKDDDDDNIDNEKNNKEKKIQKDKEYERKLQETRGKQDVQKRKEKDGKSLSSSLPTHDRTNPPTRRNSENHGGRKYLGDKNYDYDSA